MAAARPGQGAHGVGPEHLPGRRRGAQPRRLDDRGPVQVAILVDRDVARRHPDAERQALLPATLGRLDGLLHLHSTGQCLGGTREGDHDAVAQALDLTARVLTRGGTQEPKMRLLHIDEALVPKPRQHLGRRDGIREQHRQRGLHRRRLLPWRWTARRPSHVSLAVANAVGFLRCAGFANPKVAENPKVEDHSDPEELGSHPAGASTEATLPAHNW